MWSVSVNSGFIISVWRWSPAECEQSLLCVEVKRCLDVKVKPGLNLVGGKHYSFKTENTEIKNVCIPKIVADYVDWLIDLEISRLHITVVLAALNDYVDVI